MEKKENLKKGKTKNVKGYFIALGEEELTLENGRIGLFYKKEDLISTLLPNIKKFSKKIMIVEIEIEENKIISPNCIKFNLKKGTKVKIKKIEIFNN